MLLSILICCRIFHRFLCKGYARRIRLSFVGMSKEKKRGLADERASERESERAKERTNKTLLVWEHCSVATTRHGRMSSRVVGADTIESYALNFSPRAYRESKLKVPRLLWLRDSWETKSLTELETFRVCQNFTFYPPNYSKIFVRALFFFFFSPQISITFCIYIRLYSRWDQRFTSIRLYYRCYRLEKAGSIT